MCKYNELIIRRDELVNELVGVVYNIHNRFERKVTAPLRNILEAGKFKSQDIKECIGVLKFNDCSITILELAEELYSEQVIIEDYENAMNKSEQLIEELRNLKKIPGINGLVADFTNAVSIIALAGQSTDHYIENLKCSDGVAESVKRIIDITMSARSHYQPVEVYKQLTLDNLTA